jgi:ankyrin repeat protein
MAAIFVEAVIPLIREPYSNAADNSDKMHSTGGGNRKRGWLSSSTSQKVESVLLTLDWVVDISYVVDIATRTTLDVTDQSVRTCLTVRLMEVATNASSCALAASAVTECETPQDWTAPLFIVVLLSVACAAGVIADIHRCIMLAASWDAEFDSKQPGYFARLKAKGKLVELRKKKEAGAILAALLEDGLSLVATVMLEMYYIPGPWGLLAQLNVGVSVATTVLKIVWASVHRISEEREQNKPGGLCNAAAAGDIKVVKRLLRKGKSPDDRSHDSDGQNCPALIMATGNGHIGVVKELIKANVEVDAKDYCANTALTFAAQVGAGEICQLLIQAGADIEYSQPEVAMTPLAIAMYGFGGEELVSTPSGHWSFDTDEDGNIHFPPGTGNTQKTVEVLRAAGAEEPPHGYVAPEDHSKWGLRYRWLKEKQREGKPVRVVQDKVALKMAFSRFDGCQETKFEDVCFTATKLKLAGCEGKVSRVEEGAFIVELEFEGANKAGSDEDGDGDGDGDGPSEHQLPFEAIIWGGDNNTQGSRSKGKLTLKARQAASARSLV